LGELHSILCDILPAHITPEIYRHRRKASAQVHVDEGMISERLHPGLLDVPNRQRGHNHRHEDAAEDTMVSFAFFLKFLPTSSQLSVDLIVG
jgi:hypothetical protein